MITRKTEARFYAGDVECKSLEQAKLCALELLAVKSDDKQLTPELLVRESVAVIDILSTTERSLTKARKANGGKKPRKSKVVAPVVEHRGFTPDEA